MSETLKRAAELLRNYGRWAEPLKDGQGTEAMRVAADIERMAESKPVAAQCKFSREQNWQPCSVEHHYHVLANQDEWTNYETRLLYAHPRLPRDVLMAVAREVQRAAIQSCDEAGGDMGALHGIDLDAIVDRHAAAESASTQPVNQQLLSVLKRIVDTCNSADFDGEPSAAEMKAAEEAIAAAESAQAQEGGAE